ncbi:MAG: aldehyde dehydrogenase family protein [Deltaproteobacteria bacterium]|nr:aldehyde dehydrogenase family protein [Deltaproteobacteria bacterium]
MSDPDTNDNADNPTRIPILKTYKLYIGGAFPRSESGRYIQVKTAGGRLMANIARASRKDFRQAVVVARSAQAGWAKRSAFNRGQILYRLAEMVESRRAIFEGQLALLAGYTAQAAKAEVDTAIDRIVWYSGWCDKFHQIAGNTNPVSSAHFNFSFPEPQGVVAVLSSKKSPLLGLVSAVLPVIAGGNAAIAIVDDPAPTLAIEFAEALATSDLPGGVVNILTGLRSELFVQAGAHMDVDGVFAVGSDGDERKTLQIDAAETVKRTFFVDDAEPAGWLEDTRQSPYWILPFIEVKTAWHPIGA